MLPYFHADDGERIYVKIIGQGKPVVVLHGWTSNHREWSFCANAWADRYTLYCWDARGHSHHPLQSATLPTVQRMAQDLHCLIEHYGLAQPLLLGHSMGALTLWEYIRHYGCAQLSKLCLVDQSPRLVTDENWRLGIYGDFSSQRNQDFIARLRVDFAEAVLKLAAEGNNVRLKRAYERNTKAVQRFRYYLRTLNPNPLIRCWESLAQADYRNVLPLITVPTLLIYGAQSQFYGVKVADYARAAISNALLYIYENADHSPHLWQRERFIEDLRTFLQKK